MDQEISGMFSRTIIICGAGAHAPYQYPTAAQLAEKIKALSNFSLPIGRVFDYTNSLSTPDEMYDKLSICRVMLAGDFLDLDRSESNSKTRADICEQALDRFVDAFGGSQVESVDVFLAERLSQPDGKTFAIIGKLLIAYFIRDAEIETKVGFHKPDWIQHIIHQHLRFKDQCEEFLAQPPTFYTFNYDRLLERSLEAHLVHQHHFSLDDARKKVAGLGINHIYGVLGEPNFAAEAHDDISYFKAAVEDLKIAGEERDKSDFVKNLGPKVSAARATYFLGFAFEQLNMQRLFSESGEVELDNTQLYSTHVRLEPWQLQLIRNRISIPVNFYSGDVDCMKLIRELAPIFQPVPRPEIRTSAYFNLQKIFGRG